MSDMDESIKRWKEGYRTQVTCTKCGDKLVSKYSGQFSMCSCNLVFVDQTPYYARIGGDPLEMTIEEIKLEE